MGCCVVDLNPRPITGHAARLGRSDAQLDNDAVREPYSPRALDAFANRYPGGVSLSAVVTRASGSAVFICPI